jgi:formylglycine-generating enzyme required for sulfatase activity
LHALDGWAGLKPPTQAFAIAVTEVTVEQFLHFREDHPVDTSVATTPDSPVNMVRWFDAAEYCNWLSEKEGIDPKEWCFEVKAGMLDFVPDYMQRQGYRLPTEAEWEFACRAGTHTPWCCGDADEELVGKYAWWIGTAQKNGKRCAFPVAQRKPNDWGLFDMHGNVAELCQESTRPRGKFAEVDTAIRGGAYGSQYGAVASTGGTLVARSIPLATVGFRVVKSTANRLTP